MKQLYKVKRMGVQHWHVYIFGLSLVVIASAAAVRDSNFREQLSFENLRAIELAYTQSAPPASEVLGAHVEQNTLNKIRQIGHRNQNVLARLQENHLVIVEYTEDGTIVKSIDGAGNSENARATAQQWSYSINGREATVSADRFVPQDGDVILWEYK